MKVPPGVYMVSASTASGKDYMSQERRVHLAAGRLEEVSVALIEGGRLQFVVHVPDRTAGEPVEGLKMLRPSPVPINKLP